MPSRSPLLFLIVIGISVSFFLFTNYLQLGSYYFYCILSFLTLDIYFKRNIELIHVWNVAFLFIILSEVFTSDVIGFRDNIIEVLQYIFISNNLIYLGYLSNKSSIVRDKKTSISVNKNPKYISFFLFLLITFYFGFKIKTAIITFTVGRNIISGESTDSFILGAIFNALGFVLPAIIAYYFVTIRQRSISFAFLLSSPIFFILFLNGTRFPMLFAILGFGLVIKSKFDLRNKFKSYVVLTSLLVGLLFTSSLMRHLRSTTTKDNDFSFVSNMNTGKSFPYYASTFMSPEGVLDMNTLMFEYFETNDHLYGSSSGFITYFWVPRYIWPEKPTMLGYWFIREYRSGFSVGHSSSFGFTGDFYADFKYFSLIIFFFMGRVLKSLETFRSNINENFEIVLGAMLFPYVFFFVRSPITATINFFGILFFYYLFKRLIFKNSI